jgi:YfiH family protein
MIVVLQDSAFADPACGGIFHAFFTRAGGISTGIYDGLNCGPVSADDPAKVTENRSRAAAFLGVDPEHLMTLRQTHSAVCHMVRQPWPAGETPEGDALSTDRAGLAIGILTADCAPVLFAGRGPDGPVIGAAHAGWKGALGGVLEATVEAMLGLGAKRETIGAVIGPCITHTSYEVGPDFPDPFLAHAPDDERFFTPIDGGFLFDLPAYCAHRLSGTGLLRISTTGHDTCANEDRFYSFRRATLRGESDYGRGLSAIVIRP